MTISSAARLRSSRLNTYVFARPFATAPVAGARNGARAVQLAERAVAAGETADRLDTLGAALAESGRHQEAAQAIQRALNLLPPNAAELRAEYETRLALYRSGRPFHHR